MQIIYITYLCIFYNFANAVDLYIYIYIITLTNTLLKLPEDGAETPNHVGAFVI